jgi:hypothetical protein
MESQLGEVFEVAGTRYYLAKTQRDHRSDQGVMLQQNGHAMVWRARQE